MALGLAVVVWPYILSHDVVQAHSGPASQSLLAALGALCVIGIFKPVPMLPLLMFELLWKIIFLVSFALPLLLSGKADSVSEENIWMCTLAVLFVPLMPWRHIARTYFRR
jgi:hypothetical membrane protein